MGLLERGTKTSEPARILSRFPDRVVFTDPDMVEYLGDDIREDDGKIGLPWIAVNQLWRLEEKLRSWKWDDGIPTWLDRGFDESRWGHKESSWYGNKVAWMLDKYAYIQAPYTLTMADKIAPPNLSSPYRHSSLIQGWVISRVEEDAQDLLDILAEYDITPSNLLSVHLEGRGDFQATLEAVMEKALDEGYVVPSGFKSGRSLKEHQQLAVMNLAYRGGGLLADQVGLGKGGEFTCGLLALNDYLEQVDRSEASLPVVFSVTKSMKAEIVQEILKWKHDARIQMLEGTKPSPLDPTAEFYVLNHDILSPRLQDILDVEPKAFIADEAHVFKNEDAKRTKAAQELADAVRKNTDRPYVTMASGTPFLNSPVELWSILGILGKQDEFGRYAIAKLGIESVKVRTGKGWRKRKIWPKRAFEMRWCDGQYDRYGAWLNDGVSNSAELNRLLIEHGMIRRRKSDVMHPLPPLDENMVFIEPDDLAMDEYRRVEDEFKDWLVDKVTQEAYENDEDPRKAVREAIKKVMAAGDIMKMTQLRQTAAKIKVEGTVEWVKNFMDGTQEVKHLDGHVGPVSDDPTRRKLILFVHHREPRQMLLEHPDLQEYGIRHILPGGEQSDDDIQRHKLEFQKDDDARLMICSMAAREGHTLTAAKDVYLHELPFVPSWVVQMAGRAWARLSEDFEPHEAWIHYAVARGTIDPYLVRKNKLKKAMFNAVIDGEGQDDSIQDITESSAETLLEALSIGEKELGIAA